MELAQISSALSIVASRILDSVYRVATSIAGLVLVWSWFSDEHDGPGEALLSVLSRLQIPTDWLEATLTWMTEREELVAWVGSAMIFISVLSLALTSSFSDVLSQRSTSTIWLSWAALAVVDRGGAVVGWLVFGALLSLIKDLVIMEDEDKRLVRRGRGEQEWDRLGARLGALFGALIIGPALVARKATESPQRRMLSDLSSTQ